MVQGLQEEAGIVEPRVVKRISITDATTQNTVGFNVTGSEHVENDVFRAMCEDMRKDSRSRRWYDILGKVSPGCHLRRNRGRSEIHRRD